ncbi:MAG: hypothetical protein KF729_03730 [Sandaracinaceae bacterium]|nr:hypothetical protein [Sandaracinaceae bacterium]
MSKLGEVLNDPARKERVVDDCIEIIDREVADKGGLGGMAIKAGYKAVQGVKPGFVRKVVHDLLPEFADAVDPIYREAQDASRPIQAHFVKEKARVADALLAITDGKAARSQNRLVKGTYERLRGQAKSHVEAAVPRLGGLIEKHGS